MFRKMPVALVAIIIGTLICEPYLSLEIKSMLYGLSVSIKSIIMFLLPLIIFGLLFKVSSNLASHATRIIFLIFGSVCLSNFSSTLLSYGVGSWAYSFDLSLIMPQSSQELHPFWTFEMPKFIGNDKAMFSGLILGVLVSLVKPQLAAKVSDVFERFINKILASFTLLIPMFVAGFIVKLQHEGVIVRIVQDYSIILVVIALAQFSYIGFIYFAVNRLNFAKSISAVKNMLPAALTGFSTMSSAAAMPLTIMGAERNSENPDLARSVIPATVNIHLIGDCFAIPIFAFAVLKNFGVEEPSFLMYLIFAFYFVLAKFSVAGVPGGGILVMLPVLESHLGFNGEMMSLITALYILFDPVITTANVLGNGGFAMVISKLCNRLKRSQSELGFKTDVDV